MTPEAVGRPARRRRTILAVVLGAFAVLAAGATALIVSGSSEGSKALEQAQRAAAPGLQDLQTAAGRRSETVDVTWTTVPDPRGDDVQMVTARLELRPSGQITSARFLVSGSRVIPQDALARRLAEAPAG
ncbi:MAG TPA: hypothetical protein PKD59_07685 [Miltoncostaeaceae bacterium]|nr:hypothetical protein [Miltoncostaeaceae bacterium]